MAWVESGELDGRPVLHLHGEIDLSNVTELEAELRRLIPDPPGRVVIIDLAETGYIDSQGVALLLKLTGRLRERQTELHLIAPPGSAAAQLLAMSALGDLSLDGHGRADG